jgi:transmembrane sensor
MTERDERIEREAIDWLIRLPDADAGQWEAFTLWLEADPAHAERYQALAVADRDWGALAPAPRADPAPPVRRRPARRTILGGAIAASLALAIGLAAWPRHDSTYAVETAAGRHRTVALADGGRIDLNGGTRLTLDRDDPRFARLERGEALFTVAHDAARPFHVEAGDARIADLGTVFNVVRDAGGLEIGVAEGSVMFNPDRQAVRLTPGMTLRQAPGGAAELSRGGDPRAIAGWREGQLTYVSAPVARVAADLGRNLGIPVAASPAAVNRRFTGVIVLNGSPEAVVNRVAGLLGGSARRSGEGWTLTVGAGATP